MDVKELKGIGDAAAKLLYRLGLKTAQDLIENVPRDYDDYSNVQLIRSIRPGTVTIKGRIQTVHTRRSKKGLHMTEVLVSDESGSVKVTWFNQPYRAQSLRANEEYYISGEYAGNYKYLTINNPTIELVSDFPLHTARLVPKYNLTKGLSVYMLRKYTKQAFECVAISETLPRWLRDERKLIDRKSALFEMHFPKNLESLALARRRLGFDELFEMTLASELNKREFAKTSAVSIPFDEQAVVTFVGQLPYALTDDQRKAAWQILTDMTHGHPMNRLVEGDVGSGKTVVAAIAMVNVEASGMQSALMAPTEILAAQHAKTLQSILAPELAQKVVLLTGSMNQKQKHAAYESVSSGKASIVIGTHALFQESVTFQALGLIVIDEQHRFGVEQRKALQKKAHVMPHVLNMTATPIPRSLMLTLYGEMDASIIAQKPPGRTAIETSIIRPEQREKLYRSIAEIIDTGRQVFVVCPHIDESALPGRNMSVTAIQEQLSSWLPRYPIGVLHGKMKATDKEQIMQAFVNQEYKILVSTTVIEVGVDVPNATVMIIEGADRFGLAQIHQLRGRVGRGEFAGTCVLVLADNTQPGRRLKLLAKETNGFNLAEYDLELRGPGAIYGTLQHGALDLRVAKITDTQLIIEARASAKEFLNRGEKLVNYPEVKSKVDILRKITNLN